MAGRKQISNEKKALILAAIAEGMALNSVTRMFKTSIHTVLRIVQETGEACEDWHDRHFRGIEVESLQLDEQWAYCGKHKERMTVEEKRQNPDKGDVWLWAGIDPKSKAVISWSTGKRDHRTADDFVSDLADRIEGELQIDTDKLAAYEGSIRVAFDGRAEHAQVEKKFRNSLKPDPLYQRKPIDRLVSVEKEAATGNPDLDGATTSHIERFFLTVRQSNKRCARKTLAYSKKWDNHVLTASLHLFIYNMCRKHQSLKGQTPAQALGVAEKRWSLEMVVEMTDAYLERKEHEAFERAFEAKFATEPKAKARTYAPQTPKTPWYLDPESGGRNPVDKKAGVWYPDDE